MSRLIEYFLVCSSHEDFQIINKREVVKREDTDRFKTRIIDRYPEDDYKENPLAKEIHEVINM
jgi:hypothetical protein